MVNRSIEKAQRRVEGRNFDLRKNLLEYDDVANDQRQVIYQQRNELMAADEIGDMIEEIRGEVIDDVIGEYIPPESIIEQWDIDGLEQALATDFNSAQPVARWLDEDEELAEDDLRERIAASVTAEYEAKEEEWTARGIDMRQVEKQLMLQVLDQRWKEHLATMDHLRQGIHLRAYAQKQPKQEYKRESFELFQELLYNIKRDVTRLLARVQLQSEAEMLAAERRRREAEALRMRAMLAGGEEGGAAAEGKPNGGAGQGRRAAAKASTFVRGDRKVGRNEACPCGSGKKYKHCCGRVA